MSARDLTPAEKHEVERFGLSYSPEQTEMDAAVFEWIVKDVEP